MKERIKSFFKRIGNTLAPYKKNIIFPLLKIIGIIIVCAVLVRLLNGHETLADYASKQSSVTYSIEK